jgi:hypothetical protein
LGSGVAPPGGTDDDEVVWLGVLVQAETLQEDVEAVLSKSTKSVPEHSEIGNAPHLSADPALGLDDALDVLFGDPEFYEDDGAGSADWLMVGPVPGGLILVVPIAQARYSGYSKIRPITVLRAPLHIEQRYLSDKEG